MEEFEKMIKGLAKFFNKREQEIRRDTEKILKCELEYFNELIGTGKKYLVKFGELKLENKEAESILREEMNKLSGEIMQLERQRDGLIEDIKENERKV